MQTLTRIISQLPDEVQQDLAESPVNDFGFLSAKSDDIDDPFAEISMLGRISVEEALEAHGRWTDKASCLGGLLATCTAFEKRIAHHRRLRMAEIRGGLRAGLKDVSSSQLEDALAIHPDLMPFDSALLSFAEVRAGLARQQERFRTAADAASRAITAKGIDAQMMKLEVRRG